MPMSVLHDPRLTAYDRCVCAELALWVAEGRVVKVGTRKIASALDSSERPLWRLWRAFNATAKS
jgi:hypothetical protein